MELIRCSGVCRCGWVDVMVWFGWMWRCGLDRCDGVWVDVEVWFGWMWWCGLGGCGLCGLRRCGAGEKQFFCLSKRIQITTFIKGPQQNIVRKS